jgi:glutathione peroxidase
MRLLPLIALVGISAPMLACEGELLDQEFRRLASKDTVNLCETEALYETYGEKGLVVLGFPSNDFMGQEPGTEEQIQEFCRLTYGVEFPMFEKVTVKGGGAHPFYKSLADASGTYPTWNFHKYLIGRNGELIAEFSPRTQPDDSSLVNAIEQALAP